jgi:diacylglycerol kinase family enzyme
MKKVTLLHNPAAGGEDHNKKELKSLVTGNGFECRYFSTKDKGWKDFDNGSDVVAIAGGDGTVRKAIKSLLKRKKDDHFSPLAVIPLGTANNIATTLGINGEPGEVIASWQKNVIKKFDVGRVHNIPDAKFFLEGFGFGILPYLIREMFDKFENDSPEERIRKTQEFLYKTISSYEPAYCKMEVDGSDHSGNFILAEIMNTKSIGPGLVLNPEADPGDGELEVILIPENQKEKFADYLKNKLNGMEVKYQYHTLKAKNILIKWEGSDVHVDDEIFNVDELSEIEIKPGLLEFLVPEEKKEKK